MAAEQCVFQALNWLADATQLPSRALQTHSKSLPARPQVAVIEHTRLRETRNTTPMRAVSIDSVEVEMRVDGNDAAQLAPM